MTDLELVNRLLASIGELPVPDLTAPINLVQAALDAKAQAEQTLASTKYWFNSEVVTFTPVAGVVTLGADIVSVDPTDSTLKYVQRGTTLYDVEKATGILPNAPIECHIIRNIPLASLPPQAAAVVVADAAVIFARTRADGTILQALQQDRQRAVVILNKQHIRNTQANLTTASYGVNRLRYHYWRWPNF
jgi:hypothetical protein